MNLPAVVLVRFPGYTGKQTKSDSVLNSNVSNLGPMDPRWQAFNTTNTDPVVPITPFTATWESGNISCSRQQLPLALAYAMTIHKSQGLTLDRAVIALGEKDFAMGLSFVAISRVRTLKGIAFRQSFPPTRLRLNPNSSDSMRENLRKDNERRKGLSYVRNTYNQDLSMYTFLD